MTGSASQVEKPLIPELARRREEFEWAKREIQELVSGITDAQLNWRPHAGEWSIAECVAHLNLVARQLLPRMDRGIARARRKGWLDDGPFEYDRIGNWIVRLAGADQLPPRRRMKAPKVYVPARNETWLVSTTLPSFFALQDELLERVERANGVDLRRVRIASPVTPVLRLSLGQWLAMIAGHQRRHLWQAGQVKRALSAA